MSITAMKQALEALEWGNEPMAKEAITALRAAISEQEQCEPVEPTPVDLNICPNCGGEADNGFDRCYPPNPYYCKKCMKEI